MNKQYIYYTIITQLYTIILAARLLSSMMLLLCFSNILVSQKDGDEFCLKLSENDYYYVI